MFPSMPQDPRDADESREIARSAPKRPPAGFYGARPDADPTVRPTEPADADEAAAEAAEAAEAEDVEAEDVEFVPVRRQLSLAVAGFAGLLAVGLILGAQSSAPDARWPYAVVLFGVQALYLLAWIMALNPPAAGATAGICAAVALVADYLAVSMPEPGLLPLVWTALGGFVAALIAQLVRVEDRTRTRDSWRTTLAIVLGVVAYAILMVLTRQEVGTQTVVVCCAAAGVTLLVARMVDAVFPKPRIAPQVPRGATGVVLGAMLGTLGAAGLGSVLVLPFTPAKGAMLGLIAAVIASLVDLAVNFSEAGRRLAGEAPTFWLARHMQGPLGAFALVAAVAYAMANWYLR